MKENSRTLSCYVSKQDLDFAVEMLQIGRAELKTASLEHCALQALSASCVSGLLRRHGIPVHLPGDQCKAGNGFALSCHSGYFWVESRISRLAADGIDGEFQGWLRHCIPAIPRAATATDRLLIVQASQPVRSLYQGYVADYLDSFSAKHLQLLQWPEALHLTVCPDWQNVRELLAGPRSASHERIAAFPWFRDLIDWHGV